MTDAQLGRTVSRTCRAGSSESSPTTQSLPWWLSGKESTWQCRRHGFNLWLRKIPWRSKWQPTPVLLPGKSHGQKSLVGYSSWGHKELGMAEHTCTSTSPQPKRWTWKSMRAPGDRTSSQLNSGRRRTREVYTPSPPCRPGFARSPGECRGQQCLSGCILSSAS